MLGRGSILVAAALLLAGCAGGASMGGPLEPAPAAFEQVGVAGWYGEELAGRRTASGERFDPAGLTAAHRTLPLASWIEVTELRAGKSVRVRINDRGPYHGSRILDLSRAAAQRLGISGVGRVRIRSIADADDAAVRDVAAPIPRQDFAGSHYVQVGSFSGERRARALADRLDGALLRTGALWRVRVGPYRSRERAEQARAAVVSQGFGDAHIETDD